MAFALATAKPQVIISRKVTSRTGRNARRAAVCQAAKPQKSVHAAAAAVSAPAMLFASQAQAAQVVAQVADWTESGQVDETAAFYVLVGGSLAICTAVLSLVIGSNLFIKNIVGK